MRELARVVSALAVSALLLIGCGDGAATGSEQFVSLDGSARVPDDAGVVTAIDDDFATLTLDGERVYEIHDAVQSFASLDGSTQPLRARLGQYVHVGLQGDTVVWVANIGSVLRVDGQPETVVYLGSISEVDAGDRRIVMRDGTVFDAAESLDLGSLPDTTDVPIPAVIRVDVATDAVVDVEPTT